VTLRPDALILPDGTLERGLEVCLENGVISEIRKWTSPYREERDLWLSPAFVNAHSHLEYYDLMHRVPLGDYWGFLEAITALKPTRPPERIAQFSLRAGHENRRTGVTVLGEWSDFPVSGASMRQAGLKGHIFQEVITFYEHQDPTEKLHRIKERAQHNAEASGLPVHLAPHTLFTTTEKILRHLGETQTMISIHIAESQYEVSFLLEGKGPIADFYQKHHIPFEVPGELPLVFLHKLGLLHDRTQLVHACALSPEEINLIASRGASVVHCPRSNQNLQCPPAPVAQMLSRGIRVGLGMDSPASSGEIDFFAEMRAALKVAEMRGEPLKPEQVWQMATEGGAQSLQCPTPWRLQPGASPDLILIDARDCENIGDLIQKGQPSRIRKVLSFPPGKPNDASG
jgi:cytosine/adenosine deaminase-related metal-dependent hydrolase